MFEDFFYDRLIQLRLQKGISARDMSLSLGQSSGYINKVENRQILPSLTVFFYICEYLDITPKEFFDNAMKYPQQTHELIDDIQSLDYELIDSLSIIVKSLSHK